jgi:rare lipoprotein A
LSVENPKNSRFSRRNLTITLAIVGALSTLGTSSYITWSANAGVNPPADTNRYTVPAVNIDSLYTAKADEAMAVESVTIEEISPDRTISGRASWYGPGFHGRRTANGERFNKNDFTAAHKSLPFGTLLRVVHVSSGRSVLVRINDRGPYSGGRILDLSEAAATRLGIRSSGTGSVRLEIYSLPKPKDTETLSFDVAGHAVKMQGYGVRVAETSSYEEAITLQNKLADEGHKDVYLSLVRAPKGKIVYQVSLGLFSSDRLCNTLLAEVDESYAEAAIVHFGDATPSGPVAAADSVNNTDL